MIVPSLSTSRVYGIIDPPDFLNNWALGSLRTVKVYLKGPGNGRESAVRAISGVGISVSEIVDITPTPHNGCRPPKRRRV